MSVRKPQIFILGSFLFACGAAADVWSNSQGQAFDAEFLRTEGTQVVFRLKSGKQFTHSLLDLSADSQEKIRQRAHLPLEDLQSNFGRPWPTRVTPNGNPACVVISEDRKKNHYIYESAGYRFHCDARITRDALDHFATIFESTRAYLGALPLSLMSRESLGTRSRVLLFGEMNDYYQSGGMKGSAGCFLPKNRLVLIPMSSLGLVKGGTGYGRDLGKENQILIHELVHQLTPSAYFAHGALGWFSEGLAEYVAATPYNSGSFQPDVHGNAVKAFVTAYGENQKFGRNLGKQISAPPLEEFMLMNYAEFSGQHANRNYAVGLLLIHYFFASSAESVGRD